MSQIEHHVSAPEQEQQSLLPPAVEALAEPEQEPPELVLAPVAALPPDLRLLPPDLRLLSPELVPEHLSRSPTRMLMNRTAPLHRTLRTSLQPSSFSPFFEGLFPR
jgi:hypothetical protein